MPDNLRQQRFPALHIQVQRCAKRPGISPHNGGETVPPGLAEFGDPFGVEIFFAKGIVPSGRGSTGIKCSIFASQLATAGRLHDSIWIGKTPPSWLKS